MPDHRLLPGFEIHDGCTTRAPLPNAKGKTLLWFRGHRKNTRAGAKSSVTYTLVAAMLVKMEQILIPGLVVFGINASQHRVLAKYGDYGHIIDTRVKRHVAR